MKIDRVKTVVIDGQIYHYVDKMIIGALPKKQFMRRKVHPRVEFRFGVRYVDGVKRASELFD